MLKRRSLNRLAAIIKLKTLKSSMQLIKAVGEFKVYRARLMRSVPKPRLKQWWEKLMEEEHDCFYKAARDKLEQVPY
jgi:hypothetical protein